LARAHRRGDESAAAEAAQAVALVEDLLRPLAPLGEDEDEGLLVAEQAMDVRRMRGDAPDLGREHREEGVTLEEVLDGDVERARPGVLLADCLADHRRVGGQGAGVVGDEEGAAGGGNVLDPLDLGAEPIAVEELDHAPVEGALDPLRAAPVVDTALGLDRGHELALAARRQPLGRGLLGTFAGEGEWGPVRHRGRHCGSTGAGLV
jgi:hypothetical protein